MDKATEEYFADLQMLFAQPGWKRLMADLQDNAQQINSVQNTKDANDLYVRKGQLMIIGSMLNLEASIASAVREAQAMEAEQAQPEPNELESI